jgi:hypothetical protein
MDNSGAQKRQMSDTEDIPDEALIALVKRAKDRLEEKIKRLQELEVHLGLHGSRLLHRAKQYKTLIIILGAVVAARVIIDTNWENSPKVLLIATVVFTLLSAIIAIIGGLDSAFKPGETATEINFLKVKCSISIDEVEQDWAKLVERLGVSEHALANTDPLLDRINKQCAEIETRLVQLGISV